MEGMAETRGMHERLAAPASDAGEREAFARRTAPGSHRWFECAFLTVLLLSVVHSAFLQSYRVTGECMEPNLLAGERILGSRLAVSQGISRGDVVVFVPPFQCDTALVKRVIGLPGEVLEIRNSRVFVNDTHLDEPYLRHSWHDDRSAERIPDHTFFVMGDNRDESSDSRAWGLLPEANIQAKAWIRYWPPHRIRILAP